MPRSCRCAHHPTGVRAAGEEQQVFAELRKAARRSVPSPAKDHNPDCRGIDGKDCYKPPPPLASHSLPAIIGPRSATVLPAPDRGKAPAPAALPPGLYSDSPGATRPLTKRNVPGEIWGRWPPLPATDPEHPESQKPTA